MVLMMLCWTDLLDYHSTVDEETNEDLTQSCSDKSRGLPQTSHSTEQSVISSECVRVDTNLNVHEDIQVIQLTAV